MGGSMRLGAAVVMSLWMLAVSLPCGAAGFEIGGPTDPAPVEATAMRELKTYLERRFAGSSLTVDGHRDVVFQIGKTDFARRQGIDAEKLADKAYGVRILARRTPEGTLRIAQFALDDCRVPDKGKARGK